MASALSLLYVSWTHFILLFRHHHCCPFRPSPPHMEVYVHPLDEAGVASKYIVRQTSKAAHRTGPLSSSFASTPKLLRAVLRRPPPRRPATELLEKATWRDYLGVIPNPGHEPNSLLFGKGKAAYEVRRPNRPNGKSISIRLFGDTSTWHYDLI